MEELFSRETIAARIAELGIEIASHYAGKPLTLVALTNGGAFFGCDLARAIDLPLWFDTLGAASYVNDRRCGQVSIRSAMKLNPAGRHILLADDVFDSGETIRECVRLLRDAGALSVRCAVLVNKRVPGRVCAPDWSGFDAPDRYLVGCGMDSHEEYRNLACIAAL